MLLLRDSAADAADAIRGLDNVAYVTVGEKRVGGRRTGRLALIAYVVKKAPVAGRARVPPSVDIVFPDGRIRRVATDVVEIPGCPELFGMKAGHIVKAADGDIGVCGLTFVRNGASYALTNAHVVANMATGRFPGEPTVQDPATLAYKPIGKTVYISRFPNHGTDEDIAIVQATGVAVDPLQITGESLPIDRISSFEAAPGNRFWYKVNGQRVACGFPEPSVTASTVRVDGADFSYSGFWKLQVLQGMGLHGHSGALICTGSGSVIVACGLLFGGVSPDYVFAFPMDEMFARAQQRLAAKGL